MIVVRPEYFRDGFWGVDDSETGIGDEIEGYLSGSSCSLIEELRAGPAVSHMSDDAEPRRALC